jgi:threonine dehydratase
MTRSSEPPGVATAPAEGAGALPLAAALTGKAGQGPIVAILSGGNVDLKKFCEILEPTAG